MWMVENKTSYAADRNWVLDKNGAKSWVVAVKATFDILPDGSTRRSPVQLPPLLAPEFTGAPGQSSVTYEADLIYGKQKTDILLNGHAYAAAGKPAAQLQASLKVHTIAKSLQVTGDRVWEKGLIGPTLSPPQPFTKMPISYERAFGGFDQKPENPKDQRLEARNPIGRGFVVRPEHLLGQLAPNVEAIGQEITSSGRGKPSPAGFGAVASFWQPRLKYAGTYDDKWLNERLPLLPQDFDERYFQCSPEDQQANGFLRGGEIVELTNLTPSGKLTFAVPRVHLTFRTRFKYESVEHEGQLHTVILEPDFPRVILVYHTRLPCHYKVDLLDATEVAEKAHHDNLAITVQSTGRIRR